MPIKLEQCTFEYSVCSLKRTLREDLHQIDLNKIANTIAKKFIRGIKSGTNMLQALPVLFLASVIVILFQLVYTPKKPPKKTSAEKLGDSLGTYLKDYDKRVDQIIKNTE